MTPTISIYNKTDVRSTHPESFAYCDARFAGGDSGPNGPNIVSRKFGLTMPLAARKKLGAIARVVSVSPHQLFWVRVRTIAIPASAPSLSCCVSVVLGGGSKPKVCGIAARWVIAGVANKKTGRYWPYRKNVGNPVRLAGAPVHPKRSIGFVVFATRPRPTRLWPSASIHLGPESRGKVWARGAGRSWCAVLPPSVIVPSAVPASQTWRGAVRNRARAIIGVKHRSLLPVGPWALTRREGHSYSHNYSMLMENL